MIPIIQFHTKPLKCVFLTRDAPSARQHFIKQTLFVFTPEPKTASPPSPSSVISPTSSSSVISSLWLSWRHVGCVFLTITSYVLLNQHLEKGKLFVFFSSFPVTFNVFACEMQLRRLRQQRSCHWRAGEGLSRASLCTSVFRGSKVWAKRQTCPGFLPGDAFPVLLAF